MPVMQNRRILDGYFAESGVGVRPVVETDTISAIYAHVASMKLSSVIPHTWLSTFGIPDGVRVLRLPRPKRPYHVGLVLAGRHRESMLARAVVDMARQIDIGRELDQSMTARLASSNALPADGDAR